MTMQDLRETRLESLVAEALNWLERPPEDATEEMAVGAWLIRARWEL